MSAVKEFCENNFGALVVSTDGDNTPMKVCGYNEGIARVIVGVEKGGWNNPSHTDTISKQYPFYRYLPLWGIKVVKEG